MTDYIEALWLWISFCLFSVIGTRLIGNKLRQRYLQFIIFLTLGCFSHSNRSQMTSLRAFEELEM